MKCHIGRPARRAGESRYRLKIKMRINYKMRTTKKVKIDRSCVIRYDIS